MTRYVVLLLLVTSCQSYPSDRIEIPNEMSISAHSILGQIMKESVGEPKNEHLLLLELYYCEELNWPEACDQTLLRAKKRWELTDKLVDHMVAYHLKHGNIDQLDVILKRAIETRTRLEAKIEIGFLKKRNISILLNRFLDHYQDREATLFALNYHLLINDTIQSILQFEKLREEDPNNKKLRDYYPILIKSNKHNKAIEIIEGELAYNPEDTTLLFDLAISLNEVGKTDSAKTVLRNLNNQKGNRKMVDWYRSMRNWDSTLFYIDKMLAYQPNDRLTLLAKAETLEAKHWITHSLPYYERVLAMDTTDNEMARRVQIVRRKVAYLRQNRAAKRPAPILNLQRKTTTDN